MSVPAAGTLRGLRALSLTPSCIDALALGRGKVERLFALWGFLLLGVIFASAVGYVFMHRRTLKKRETALLKRLKEATQMPETKICGTRPSGKADET